MSQMKPVEYADAAPEVKAVYDDIKEIRGVPDVNNFWKYIAQHPPTLARTWDSLKDVMATGALDPLIKELLYVAVSVTNNCGYCGASHTAAARRAGMTDEMFRVDRRGRNGERDEPACDWISRAYRSCVRVSSRNGGSNVAIIPSDT